MPPRIGAASGVRVAASLLWRALVVNVAAATNWERFAIGPFVLVLALLSLIVAGAGGTRRQSCRMPERAGMSLELAAVCQCSGMSPH